MNKILKWGLILSGFFVFLMVSLSKDDNEVTDKFKEGYEAGRQSVEQEVVEPTVAPTPEVESAEQTEIDNYFAAFLPINAEVQTALGLMGDLDFKGAIAPIDSAYRKARALTPPERLASPHQKWVKAIELFKQAIHLANKGIDAGNTDLLYDAVDLTEQGTALLDEAIMEVEEIIEANGPGGV